MKIKKIIPMVAFASISLSAMAQGQTLSSGIDLKNMDNSVRPQDDFFQYACGGWMKNNPLPAAYSRYGSFDVLGEDNNKRINGILTELLLPQYIFLLSHFLQILPDYILQVLSKISVLWFHKLHKDFPVLRDWIYK